MVGGIDSEELRMLALSSVEILAPFVSGGHLQSIR